MRIILLRIFYVIEIGFAIFAIIKLFRIKLPKMSKKDYIDELQGKRKWNDDLTIDLSVIMLIFFVITLIILFINQK